MCFDNLVQLPDEYVWMSYNEINNTVNYTAFSDPDCTGSVLQNSTSDNITVNECVPFGRFRKDLYVNFTVSEEFPYPKNEITTKHWIKSERFSDEKCEKRNGKSTSGFLSVSFTSSNYFKAFCSDEYIVNTISEFQNNVIEVLPRSLYENKCSLMFPLQPKTHPGQSRKLSCETNVDVVDNEIAKIGKLSTHKYSKRFASYHQNCSTHYSSLIMALDSCIFGAKFKTGVDENSMYSLAYLDYLCQTSFEQFGYVTAYNGNELFDKCLISGDDKGFNLYDQLTLTDDPYSTDQMAYVQTAHFKCGEDMKSIMKDPGKVGSIGTEYYDKEYCVKTWGSELTPLGLSMKGRCENGKLVLDIWTDSKDCSLGVYNTHEFGFNEICDVLQTPVGEMYQYILCIPRYCGDYSESDEKVCTNHGKCMAKDSCSCEEGYYGMLCDDWSCFGYDKDDLENVCGYSNNIIRGKCVEYNKCVCNRGYSGEECFTNSWYTFTILSSVFGSLLCSTIVGCCGCCLIFVVCFISSLFLACVASVCGFSGYVLYQRIRLAKFEELEDFEILLQEQNLEKDTTMAHLKINKRLFEIEYDEIKVTEKIGEGGSDALVFLATWRGTKVAFKCFKTRKICSTQETFNHFETEVNLLINLNHPNVIRFYGAALKPPRVGIVMEYCENGEILQFIQKYREENEVGYALKEKLRMTMEMVASLEYIHSRNIIHRDIKPENVLIDSNEHCKIMDFGISKIVESSTGQQTKRVGTNFFIAPEILSGEYDNKCDSFSFAILLWIVFSEIEKPYGENDFQVELRVANDHNFRPNITKTDLTFGEEREKYHWMKDMILRCWDHDPEKRYGFSEMKNIIEENTDDCTRNIVDTSQEDVPGESKY